MEFDENLNPINRPNDSSWGPRPNEGQKPSEPNPIEPANNQPPIDPPTPPQFTPAPAPAPMPDPVPDVMPTPDPMPMPDDHPPIPKHPIYKGKGMVWGVVGIFMIVAVIAIVAISVSGNSQTILPSQQSTEQGLRITETGKAYATPDVAKISFNVNTEAKDIAASQKDNSDRTATIKNDLARFKIASADIKTINYSISPDYDYRIPRQPRLKGYRTNHSLEITIRNLEDTDAIVQTLGNSGITGINQVRFTVDDITEVQNEAREEAIAKAKEKAKQLASLSGAKLGKIIFIQENNSPLPPIYRPMTDAIGLGGVGKVETGLEEGSALITSTITIIYSLN